MRTTRVDAKRRIVVPGTTPGDIYVLREVGEGTVILDKLRSPEGVASRTASDVLAAIEEHPLTPRMTWAELRTITRDA